MLILGVVDITRNAYTSYLNIMNMILFRYICE